MNKTPLYHKNEVNTICSAKTPLVRGFTIVELLVAIVVIGILAAIIIVTYNTMTQSAAEASLKSDLAQAVKVLDVDRAKNGNSYPSALAQANRGKGLQPSDGNTFQYTSDGSKYCLTITSTAKNAPSYKITNTNGTPEQGLCSGHKNADGNIPILYMQTITAATCPVERTMAVDARDNRTYWVQKLGASCWMLTNLAYAGIGTNTYKDTRYLMNGTSDTAATYTSPKYYIPSKASPTTYPTEPSARTYNEQYGYLYNFCGATGAQSGTGSCSTTSLTAVSPAISVCPSGWRLPTTGTNGEFKLLNDAVNNGSTSSMEGLRDNWLVAPSGYWDGSYTGQDGAISYWSYMQSSSSYAYMAEGTGYSTARKNTGRAVRCIAN